jgi:hypothetical protein
MPSGFQSIHRATTEVGARAPSHAARAKSFSILRFCYEPAVRTGRRRAVWNLIAPLNRCETLERPRARRHSPRPRARRCDQLDQCSQALHVDSGVPTAFTRISCCALNSKRLCERIDAAPSSRQSWHAGGLLVVDPVYRTTARRATNRGTPRSA